MNSLIKRNVLLYGGSFDPIHNGHLNTALTVQRHFAFEHFLFLPCKAPLLKNNTMASSDHRVRMLQLALAPYPEFGIDLCEITRDTPSYMVDTLHHFRRLWGETTAITLLLGMDAFLQLPHWHCWNELIKLTNLLIMSRASYRDTAIPEPLTALLLHHETLEKHDLLQHPYGKMYRFDAGEYPVSSTELRHKLRTGNPITNDLPADVYQHIVEYKLYC